MKKEEVVDRERELRRAELRAKLLQAERDLDGMEVKLACVDESHGKTQLGAEVDVLRERCLEYAKALVALDMGEEPQSRACKRIELVDAEKRLEEARAAEMAAAKALNEAKTLEEIADAQRALLIAGDRAATYALYLKNLKHAFSEKPVVEAEVMPPTQHFNTLKLQELRIRRSALLLERELCRVHANMNFARDARVIDEKVKKLDEELAGYKRGMEQGIEGAV